MFIPIFVLSLIFWLGLARLALRLVKLDDRKKIWRWFLVATLAICTFDHIVGIIYAHIWVAMAQGKNNVTLKTDSVAFQGEFSDEQDKQYYFRRKPTYSKLESHFWLDGYKQTQIIMPAEQDTDGLEGRTYELELSNNSNDQNCKQFFALPKNNSGMKPWELDTYGRHINQEDLLKVAAKNFMGSEKAHCIAARPISQITAKYLQQYTILIQRPPDYPSDPFSYNYTKITDLRSGDVVCEKRHVVFLGGWVFRYFWIDPNSGYSPGYSVGQPGVCEVVSTERQQLQR